MRPAPRHRPRARAAALLALLTLPTLGALRAVPAWAMLSSSAGASQQISTGTLAAPTNLSAAVGTCVRGSAVTVQLTWDEPPDPGTNGYDIFRSTDGGPSQLIATVSDRATTSYTDTTTTFSTTYSYAVRSTRNLWTGPDSNPASITTPVNGCK